MTPDQILKPLFDDLESYADDFAQVEIAGNANEALALMAQGMEGPYGFIIALLWNGDDPATEYPQAAIMNNEVELYVGHNEGLSLEPGQDLLRGKEPIYRVACEIREHVRKFDYSDVPEIAEEQTEDRLVYMGGGPVALPEGVPLRAFRFRFQLTASLPTINLPDNIE